MEKTTRKNEEENEDNEPLDFSGAGEVGEDR